jgi:anaerobic ribonucleoside-triphosphate reductase activating protein
MKYGKINKTDIANGPGVRVSLFVSGCRNRCPGCFNPETWSFNYGEDFTRRTLDEILEALRPDYIAGLSILGGDPFEPENIAWVVMLCMIAKEVYPDKTIWVYTGYQYEDLKYLSVMEYIDVLVDGPFIEAQKDITLKFRGSKNQRIIDVPASRSSGTLKYYKIL